MKTCDANLVEDKAQQRLCLGSGGKDRFAVTFQDLQDLQPDIACELRIVVWGFGLLEYELKV